MNPAMLTNQFVAANNENRASAEIRFLGFPMQKVRKEDRPAIESTLMQWPQPLSGYQFSTLISWGDTFQYQWRKEDDNLIISLNLPGEKQRCLLQPIGPFSSPLPSKILYQARQLSEPLKLLGVSQSFLEQHSKFAAHFNVEENRDGANYRYLATNLATLGGKKYSKKRNHISQAQRQYQWTVEPLGPRHERDCLQIAQELTLQPQPGQAKDTLEQETKALKNALRYFSSLRLQGILIRVDERPCAFAIFDRMNSTTAVVLFEKALRDFHGMHQIVNQETAKILHNQGYLWINREEDLGNPGLRKAKLSYFPDHLDMSYILTFQK